MVSGFTLSDGHPPEQHELPITSPAKSMHRGTAALNPRSTVLNHDLPRSYACYLLRSFGKRTATYIGSTPDPPRRIKQHNGLIVGGAFKTRLGRPWETELIVYGFPSKLQALQFEWAWQNPHASRHLHATSKDTVPVTVKSRKKATDSATESAPAVMTRPSAQFPKSSLSNRPQTKIQALQYMITSKPWTAFNLQVMLFSRDAQTWWNTARKRLGPVLRTEAALKKWEKARKIEADKHGVDIEDAWGAERGSRLDQVKVTLREEGVDGERLVRQGAPQEPVARAQIQDDALAEEQWAKFMSFVGPSDSTGPPIPPASIEEPSASPAPAQHCTLCASPIDASSHLSFTLCTASTSCNAAHHLPCLASHMLLSSPVLPASSPATPAQALATRPLLPTTGHCPACDGEVHWQDLIRGAFRRDERSKAGTVVKKTRAKKGTGEKTDKKSKSRDIGTSTSKAKNKGKGKSKAISPSDLDLDEDSSAGEVYDLTSDNGALDEDDDPDATEAERSFARLAEEDSLDELGEDGVISSSDEDELEAQEFGFYDPQPAASTVNIVASQPARGRGRPKKAQTTSVAVSAAENQSPAAKANKSRLGLASSKPGVANKVKPVGSPARKNKERKEGKKNQVEYIELSD